MSQDLYAEAARQIWPDGEETIRQRRRLEEAVRQALRYHRSPLPLTDLTRLARAIAFGPARPWLGGFSALKRQRGEIEAAVGRLEREGDIVCEKQSGHHFYRLRVEA